MREDPYGGVRPGFDWFGTYRSETALEAANKENGITRWLKWFAGVAIEGQHRIIALVEYLIDKTKLLDRLKGQLNPRQEKALARILWWSFQRRNTAP